MMLRPLLLIVVLLARPSCQAARTSRAAPTRPGKSHAPPANNHGSSAEESHVPWHTFHDAEHSGFLGSPGHLQGSHGAHSDIDWDELDKVLGNALPGPNSPRSPARLPESSPSSRQAGHQSPSSHSPWHDLDLDFDFAPLQGDIHDNSQMSNPSPQHDHEAIAMPALTPEATANPSKGKSVQVNRSSKQEAWSNNRYNGHPWQENLSKEQQEKIYKALRSHWGPYHQLKYRTAYQDVRKLLDAKTAQLILAGHKQTIADIGAKTNPYSRPRRNARKKSREDLHWPDESFSIEHRSDIVNKLGEMWKMKAPATRKRLYTHYQPHMRSAFQQPEQEDFKKVAMSIHAKSEEGKMTRLRAANKRPRRV